MRHFNWIILSLPFLATQVLAGPEIHGTWGNLSPTWPIQPIHAVLLNNGMVLLISKEPSSSGERIVLFNPSDPITTVPPTITEPVFSIGEVAGNPQGHLFCAGHAHLPDGRVAFYGGMYAPFDKGYDTAHDRTILYDPGTPGTPWDLSSDKMLGDNQPGQLPRGRRYYPTATALADGMQLIVSGGDNTMIDASPADVPNLFNYAAGTGFQYERLVDAELLLHWYPFMFQLLDGTILAAGSYRFFAPSPPHPICGAQYVSRILNIATETWTAVDCSAIKGGSAVMYRPNKIMMAGGGVDQSVHCSPGDMISNQAMTIDMSAATPAWTSVGNMNYARIHFYLVVLPDGRVLAVGGSGTPVATECDQPVLAAELYDPAAPSPSWQVMASMTDPRMYHSVAVLLPDATVLVAGGENLTTYYKTAQIYSPPYLFAPGGGPATRPTMSDVPATIYYGAHFTVSSPNATQVTAVSLIGLSAATHSFDHNQRFVPLTFTASGTTLTINAPPNGCHAPPQYYMLFILVNGVPSEAKFVRLMADPAACPTGCGPTLFVDAAITTPGAGTTWGTAFNNIQTAIDAAMCGNHRIMVKAGNYNGPLTLKDGVAIYGGFNGTETSPIQANYRVNVTNILGSASTDHVVLSFKNNRSAILRGFHIKNGNANGAGNHAHGGGLYLENSSAQFVQCVFTNNDANGNGAAVANMKNSSGLAGSPSFVNCTFHRNKDVNLSGEVQKGGAIFSEGGNPTFTNCLIHKNESHDGAGLYIDSGVATLINCTLADNTATNHGGGMYDKNGQSIVRNSISASNSGMVAGSHIYNVSGTTTVTYSAVRGWAGEGNIDATFFFVDRFADNYNLVSNSQCIDAGRNSDLPADSSDIDWDGNITEILPKDQSAPNATTAPPWILDVRVKKCVNVDMGALESQVECSEPE